MTTQILKACSSEVEVTEVSSTIVYLVILVGVIMLSAGAVIVGGM